MRSRFELKPHSVLRGEQVVEIWFENRMVGMISSRDGCGIRVTSKYELATRRVPHERATPVEMIEVLIGGG